MNISYMRSLNAAYEEEKYPEYVEAYEKALINGENSSLCKDGWFVYNKSAYNEAVQNISNLKIFTFHDSIFLAGANDDNSILSLLPREIIWHILKIKQKVPFLSYDEYSRKNIEPKSLIRNIYEMVSDLFGV